MVYSAAIKMQSFYLRSYGKAATQPFPLRNNFPLSPFEIVGTTQDTLETKVASNCEPNILDMSQFSFLFPFASKQACLLEIWVSPFRPSIRRFVGRWLAKCF